MEGRIVNADEWQRRPGRTLVGLFALLATLLFGGMAVGLAIATLVAGESLGALVVGFFALPLCLGIGLTVWRAALFAWVAGGTLSALVRSRGDEGAFRQVAHEQFRHGARSGLPFTWIFVPIASAVSLVEALLMALLAERDRLLAAALILLAGIAYGVLLRRLAERGWLPPPGE
jgi:hypothetical protein